MCQLKLDQKLEVIARQNDLPYGLLGHDVSDGSDGYNFTIKESSIEFRKR